MIGAMLYFYPKKYLTENENLECIRVANLRLEAKHKDGDDGMRAAKWAYGKFFEEEPRDTTSEYEQEKIGAFAELMVNKAIPGSIWTKALGQYKNKKQAAPDLWVPFQGTMIRADVRGTKYKNYFIFRETDFDRDPDELFFFVDSLPSGPTCQIAWSHMGRLQKIVSSSENLEWFAPFDGKPIVLLKFSLLSPNLQAFKK